MTKRPTKDSCLDNGAETKQEEVEVYIQARRESQKIDENIINIIVSYIEEKITPFALNQNGIKGLRKLCSQFDYPDILDAIDISEDKYLKYDSDDKPEKESVETFITKIGGIVNLQNRPPIDLKMAYVKGICRNRFNYWNEWQGSEILQTYVNALINCQYSEDEILDDFDEEVIPKTKTTQNWSQWRNMMERWTEEVNGWAEDLRTCQQAQQHRSPNPSNPFSCPPTPEADPYIEEKRKGGANSYQAYKPLRDMVEQLCKSELDRANHPSANQLCNQVAAIIEADHPELLDTFQPYQNHELDGNDWKRPTFYGWCNTHYKAHKEYV